ncbi:MAG: enoyl-CoA hydratase [Deltaproteobacteria bacterium HGW-Deltaproteobacteria-14]|jgi:3-hydroxybutyryl-CoA dehydratase|nr:MAG: enoyl-CoA hydratase [Deltaproteobacteria bacterium HGW-Deltaproteobacteria-14]
MALPAVGASASLDKTITEQDIELFGQVSLDKNPVHFDEAYAKNTRFGGRIAHGMISAGLISAVIGTQVPGPGSIYLSQSLKFRAPVRIGDTVTATVTVTAVREDKPIVTLETVAKNQAGEVLVTGEAVILVDG